MKLFTAEEKRLLNTLRSKAVNKEEVLTIEAIHGFFFGLATIPDLLMPSQWLPVIFGEEMIVLENKQEADSLFGPLFAVYNRFMRDNRLGALLFPFDIGALRKGDVAKMGDWTYGFHQALLLSKEIWPLDEEEIEKPDDETTDDEKELAAAFGVIMGIAMPEQIPEIFETETSAAKPDKEDVKLMATLFTLLPDAVAAIQEQGRDLSAKRLASRAPSASRGHIGGVTIPRNDPCPCGSGKKFKRCCGMN